MKMSNAYNKYEQQKNLQNYKYARKGRNVLKEAAFTLISQLVLFFFLVFKQVDHSDIWLMSTINFLSNALRYTDSSFTPWNKGTSLRQDFIAKFNKPPNSSLIISALLLVMSILKTF